VVAKLLAAWLVQVCAAVEGVQQGLGDEGVVVAVAVSGAPDPTVFDLAGVDVAERVDQAEIRETSTAAPSLTGRVMEAARAER